MQQCILTTFLQFNFGLETPELLGIHQQIMLGNSKILHCGMLLTMPYHTSLHDQGRFGSFCQLQTWVVEN